MKLETEVAFRRIDVWVGTGMGKRYFLYTFLYLLPFEPWECFIWLKYQCQKAVFIRVLDLSI